MVAKKKGKIASEAELGYGCQGKLVNKRKKKKKKKKKKQQQQLQQ